jgi:hypothetical protein
MLKIEILPTPPVAEPDFRAGDVIVTPEGDVGLVVINSRTGSYGVVGSYGALWDRPWPSLKELTKEFRKGGYRLATEAVLTVR